jgi:zinc-ribbon domain
MKCPECGAEVEASEKFCGNCGAPTAPSSPAPDVPQPEVSSRDETILSAGPALPSIEGVQPSPAASEPVLAAVEEPVPPSVAHEPVPPPIAPEPIEPPRYAPPSPPAKGKSKTGWIIAIVVVVVLLLCCCSIVAIALLITQTDAGRNLMQGFSMLAPALTAWA